MQKGAQRLPGDSAPDRWGQMLMRRREALVAKDEVRAVLTCPGTRVRFSRRHPFAPIRARRSPREVAAGG